MADRFDVSRDDASCRPDFGQADHNTGACVEAEAEEGQQVKTRTVTEYRVVSTRADQAPKVKRYRSMPAVRDRVGRLMSPEPWRFFGAALDRKRDADDLLCCTGGHGCGCGGETVREHYAAERAPLPVLESVRVEKRQVTVTAWEATDMPNITLAPEVEDRDD